MNLTELSNRRTELLRKRYAGEIESETSLISNGREFLSTSNHTIYPHDGYTQDEHHDHDLYER